MKAAVIGTGYVGLVTGAVLAQLGNDVICVDKDQEKLGLIASGRSPIYEPGLEEILDHAVADGFLKVSTSIPAAVRDSEIIFIAVGTPPGADGSPDMSAVKAVAGEIAKGIDSYKVIVNKSTVPVGSGDMVGNILAEAGVPRDLYDVVSNPEFLREGSAVRDTLEPDRIVIGASSNRPAAALLELYKPLDRPVLLTDVNSAELIKYASNSFLAMKISFINAISVLCEQCGANIADVAKGMGADNRIGASFLQAGLGWGGSCFPKDVLGLIKISEQLGYDFRLLQEVWNINEEQTHRFVDRLKDSLSGLNGKRIGLLGLAFKPNTDDIRDAKSLIIIDQILKEGGSVQAYDPAAAANVKKLFPDIDYVKTPYAAADGADALVVVTEWNEFKHLSLDRISRSMKGNVLFDGRRIYSPDRAAAAGLKYFAIGLQSESAGSPSQKQTSPTA